MVLPHLLGFKTYKDFYRDVPGYKILDNGEAEGYSFAPVSLINMGKELGVDEIVVPDTIGDCDDTIKKLWDFKAMLADTLWHGSVEVDEFKFMGVVQGKTHAELMKCVNAFVYNEFVQVIGIPRHLYNSVHKTMRLTLAEWIHSEFPHMEIHLLGAHENVKEAILAADLGFVRGTDTSAPVVIGLEGKDIRHDYVKRQLDFFDRDAAEFQRKWIDHNVTTFIDWCDPQASGSRV